MARELTTSGESAAAGPGERTTRREALRRASCGFGYLALAGLCADAGLLAGEDASAPGGGRAAGGGGVPSRRLRNPLAAREPHFAPRAKRVIFLFMQGGPSQVDTYDPKPLLDRHDGATSEFLVARTRKVTPERLLKSPWRFSRHGECGQAVSELFPEMARHVDRVTFLKGMHTEGVAHGPATLALHTGATSLVRPSMGSWVTYGLGSENESLPGFVTLSPSNRMGGPRNYSNAFLPSVYQGTTIGRVGIPVTDAGIAHLSDARTPRALQQERFDLLRELQREQLRSGGGRDDALESVVSSFELAWRMQTVAPEVLDISSESEATRRLYGIGEKPTDEYGRQCLQARRLAEAGVRYIQVNYSDDSNNPRWDQHSNLKRHEVHARATDKPVAGLLQDLAERGLLEDTLLWWGAEFGRTPFAQGRDGRDHNPNGFTIWLAGGGVKAGYSYGGTDDYGYNATEGRVHMHDLHATVLHLLGLDHERLTYRYAGRDFRLTDVYGDVVHDILA